MIYETKGQGNITQVKKLYLRNVIKRFLNHREFMYKTYKSHATDTHLKALEKVKRYFEHYKNSDLRGHCHLIITMADDLKILLPGKSSVFNKGYTEKIEDLINFSKNYIDGSINGTYEATPES
jgi:hypothetical protein